MHRHSANALRRGLYVRNIIPELVRKGLIVEGPKIGKRKTFLASA